MLTMSQKGYAGQLFLFFSAVVVVGANVGLKESEYFSAETPSAGQVSVGPPVEMNVKPDAIDPRLYLHPPKRVRPIRSAIYIEAIGEGDSEPVRWAI
jgi:hypothetical protein